MSDQAQGPGWWLASDGRWYPPEQAPAAPPAAYPPPVGPAWPTAAPGHPAEPFPAAPPAPPGGPLTTVAIVVGGLLTLAVVALLFVGILNRGGPGDRTETVALDGTTTSVLDSSSTSASSSPAATSTSAASVADSAPAGFRRAQGDGVSMVVPESWTPIAPEDFNLPADQLARIFPDADSAVIEQSVALARQGARLIAVDSSGTSTPTASTNVLAIPGGVPLDLLEEQARAQYDQLGAEVGASEHLDLPAGPAVRLPFALTVGGIRVPGLQYLVSVDGDIYIITIGASDAQADVMARSFRVG